LRLVGKRLRGINSGGWAGLKPGGRVTEPSASPTASFRKNEFPWGTKHRFFCARQNVSNGNPVATSCSAFRRDLSWGWDLPVAIGMVGPYGLDDDVF